ncbi:uncharacterized protein LOC110070582 [Pogona vitticeps]
MAKILLRSFCQLSSSRYLLNISPVSPTLFPLLSCCDGHGTEPKESITFACLLSISYPTQSEIQWEPNGHKKTSFPPISHGTEQLSTSQLTVPFSEFVKTRYKCILKLSTDPQRGEPPSAIIDYKACNLTEAKPIQGQIISPNCNEHTTETTLELVCLLHSLGPGKANVQWLKNGKMEQKQVLVILTEKGDKENGHIGFARQEISKASWDKGDEYTCKVTPQRSNQNVTMYTTSKCTACYGLRQQPTVSVTKPAYRDLLEKTAKVTCTAIGLNLKNTKITWQVDGQPSADVPDNMAQPNAIEGPNVTSSHPVSLAQWKKGTTFTCKVAGGCYEDVIQAVEVKKETEAPEKPSITLARASLGVSLENSTALILVCDVIGFFPREISISWRKDGVPLNETLYENGVVTAATRNLFKTYSILKLGREEAGGKGGRYSCVVYHSSSDTEIIASENVSFPCYGLRQQPTVSVTKPAYRDLLEKTAKVTCTAIGLNLKNTKITWQVDGQPSADVPDNMAQPNTMEGPNVTSSHPVSLAQWKKGTTFTCKVAGGCYEDVIQAVEVKKETEAPEKPSITLARASLGVSLENSTALILVCDVIGFFPREISISWRKDGVPLNETLYENGVVTVATRNLFKTYSILKLGREEAGGKGGHYSCVVYHSSSDTEIIASENVSFDFLAPSPPQVMVFLNSENKEHQTLICFATNFYPKEIDIRWNIKGRDLSCISDSSTAVSLVDGKFQKNCSVVLSGEEWSKLEMYTCTVNHSSTNVLIKKKLHFSRASYCAGMVPTLNNTRDIDMQLPSFEELFVNKSATLTCMMPLMNITPSSTFSWTMDGQPADRNAVTTSMLNETNSTAWIYSQLQVNLTEWRTTMEFNCSIPNSPGETKQRIYRRNGIMRPPKVSLQHYSSNEDLNVTLLCMAKDFYPGEIFLKWEEENQELSLKGYDVKDLKCNHEQQRCSLMSILEVPTSHWMTGMSYTCLVAHISSENIITRRVNSLSDPWDCTLMGVALRDLHNENPDEGSELEEANTVWNKVSTFMVLFVAALSYAGLVTFIKVIVPENGDITIGCLAKDFLPDSVTFSWNNKNNASLDASKFKRFPSLLSDGTYTASSQAKVSVDDWKAYSPFFCQARQSDVNKVVRVVRRACPRCPDPEMNIQAPSCKAFQAPYFNSTITCTATNLCTEKTTIQWSKDGQLLDSGFTTTKLSLNNGNGYGIRSELIVSLRDWNANKKYSCTVQNDKYKNTLEIQNPDFCEEPCRESLEVETIPPSYADIYVNQEVKLTCKISNIPYEQDLGRLAVTWTRRSNGINREQFETELGTPQDQGNGRQSIDASTTVCIADWNSGDTFSCKVEFPDVLPEPVEKSLKKPLGIPVHAPAVYVLPPPSEQLALRETATVTCLIKNFSPSGIFVQWLHNNKPVSPGTYFTSTPTLESRNQDKYFAYSMLNIDEQQWSAGDTYTCLVGHEGLPFNATQKTIDKNMGKPTIVNVSLVLSDTANTC